MREFVASEKEIGPKDLLNFYTGKLAFYRRWATLNSCGYWALVWASVLCTGVLVATMLFQAGTTYVAASAVGLNILFAVGQILRCDKKYPRCRFVQIRLDFALHEFKCAVAREVHEGKSEAQAIFNCIPTLHEKAQKFILEEYAEFFRDMKTLDDLYKSMVNSTQTSPSGHTSGR